VDGNYVDQLGTGVKGDADYQFYHPRGVNIAPNGDIYIADTYNHKIKVYNSNLNFRFNTSLGVAKLEPCYPCQVMPIGNDKFFVSDTGNSQLLQYEKTLVTKHVGELRTGNYAFSGIAGVTIDKTGNYYVSDSLNHRVLKYNSSGLLLSKWGGNSGNGGPGAYGMLYWQFTAPKQIWYSQYHNKIFIADTGNSRIQVFTTSGTWTINFGYGVFSNPMGVCTTSNGDIYISDTMNNRIMRCNSAGITISTWGGLGTGDGQFNMPTYLAVDSQDNIYVVDRSNCRVQKFDRFGKFVTKWGTNGGNANPDPLDNWGIGDGDLFLPIGIAIDGNLVYVTDSSNNRVEIYNTNGNYLEQFGIFSANIGDFFSPQGIAVKNSRIYVTDALLNRLTIFQRVQNSQ
jgi:DNA-binding beta-propeller fold protein YncE